MGCHVVTTPAQVCCCRSTTSLGSVSALPAPPSCPPTLSPNLLAALPHFISRRCGLSLIITYWFLTVVAAARLHARPHLNWRPRPSVTETDAPRLWFEQGQTNQSALIEDLQRDTRIVCRRGRLFPPTRMTTPERRRLQDNTWKRRTRRKRNLWTRKSKATGKELKFLPNNRTWVWHFKSS